MRTTLRGRKNSIKRRLNFRIRELKDEEHDAVILEFLPEEKNADDKTHPNSDSDIETPPALTDPSSSIKF